MRRIPSVPTFYVMTLTGISVGGAPLAIPPSAFSNGMVIDSGTVITGLLATAYAAVTAASDAATTSDLLRDLTPESYVNDTALRQKAEDDHGIGLLGGDDDLPAFDRLWKYCCGYAGPCAGMPPCILVVGGEPRRCAAATAPPWLSCPGSGRPRVSRLCSAQRGRRRGKERKESREWTRKWIHTKLLL
uniref:Xylanase inhibitor C-terminal domain-containing protein n=1 Tax=Oryza barthii TaxID=65489 RepID=A0A0D3G4B6_9ORYZ